jgi:penicillin-binding protein 2
MRGQRFVKEAPQSGRHLFRLSLGVSVLFFILLMRLWYLQIVKAEDYQNLSENNRLRLVPVAAPRGTILDRNGKLLIWNRPSFSVVVFKQDVKNKDQLLGQLINYLDLDRNEIYEKWGKSQGRAKYYPITVASGITQDQLEFLEENLLTLPGVDVQMKPVREYADGGAAVHLVGYIGEISEPDLAKEEFNRYNSGDYIGKNGLERVWEGELHGKDGGRQIEVDARGRVLRTVSENTPTNGNSLLLTIDRDIQERAEKALGDKAGAAVALDVHTGEVLAFASSPAFDPELFTGRIPKKIWDSYMEDVRHPLINKVLTGQYPPGSTFKIITALAGLEEGLIDEHTTVNCPGSYTLGNRTFHCWQKRGHGSVNLKLAIKQSCDVYFYHLADRLGVDRIANYAQKFRLGVATGIPLEHEKPGLIPSTAWKEKKYGQKWARGETISVGIGQGYVLTTPLQLASMTAAVANGGTVYRPFVVRKVVDQDGKVLREFKPEVLGTAGISERSLALVRNGLQAVVNEPGGTGGAARIAEVKVAGKTGTSQVVKLRTGKGNPYQFRDHALFVAFAPVENPEIAVAVVIEHGEHGGSAAAPVAGAMLRAYFEGKGVIKKPVARQGRYSSTRGGGNDAEPAEHDEAAGD